MRIYNAPKTIQGKKAIYYAYANQVLIVPEGIKVLAGQKITREYHIKRMEFLIKQGLI